MLTIGYAVTMTEPHDTEVGIAELKSGLSDFVNRVIYRSDVMYVTKHGKRVAALVPVEVAERYEAEQQRREFQARADRDTAHEAERKQRSARD